MLKIVLLIILIAFLSVSFAIEPGRAKNNLAHEYADCAAYYMLLIRDAKRYNEIAWGKRKTEGLAAHAMAAMEISKELANGELIVNRINMTTKTMMEDMGHNWSNILIVINKYLSSCYELIENPER